MGRCVKVAQGVWVWSAALWEWLFHGNPCPARRGRGVGEQDPQGSFVLCLWLCQQRFTQALLMLVAVPKCSFQRGWWGNKGANKIWMLPWLLVPAQPAGARAAWKGLKSTNRSKYQPGCARLNRCCVLRLGVCFLMQMFVSSLSTQNCTLT